MPDVDVTLTAAAPEVVQSTTSDEAGRYAVENLPEGGYTWSFRHPGFKVLESEGKASAGTSTEVSATMEVGVLGIAAAPEEPGPYLELARFYDAAGRAGDSARVTGRALDLTRLKESPPSGLGGRVTPPLSVRHVMPTYPAAAAGSRGVVILEATIGADGVVRSVNVRRGVPALDAAAMSALERWLYAPALLNGTPVEVGMMVTMNFE